jgi:hypothetical protein
MKPWHQWYPRRHWLEEDWQAWEKAGKPKVPRDPVLEQQGQPLNQTLSVPPPLVTLSAGFSLHPKKSTARDARGKQVDKLLEKLGVR